MTILALIMVLQIEELPAYSTTSYAFSKQITVNVSPELFNASPKWDDDAENPPLSARKAILLTSRIRDLVASKFDYDEHEFKWKLRSASLQQSEHETWFWLVSYEAEGKLIDLAGNDRPHRMDLIVLMNGIVVPPKVQDIKRDPAFQNNEAPIFGGN